MTLESVRMQPKQHVAVLYAILSLFQEDGARIRTGDAYAAYGTIAPDLRLRLSLVLHYR